MKRFRVGLSRKLALVWCCLLIGSTVTTAQVRVSRISGEDQLAGKSGVLYQLPRTVLTADVEIVKTLHFAGPLAAYASEYMGIDDAIMKDAESYVIGHAAIRAISEPDPDQVYLIEREDKSQEEIWVSFGKEPPVMILEKFPKAMGPTGFADWNEGLYMASERGGLFRKYTDSPTREVSDTIIRKVSVDTLIIEQRIVMHSREEYSDVEKAQDAADKIRQIEHDQYNLLIGYPETAYSKDALEFMLNRLEKQRLEYLQLFTGVTIKESQLVSFPVIPDAEKDKQEYELTGFSKTTGLTDAEGQNRIMLRLIIDEDAAKPGIVDQNPGSGLVYRVPGFCRAELSYQDKPLAGGRYEVLQFGSRMSLPPAFRRIELDLHSGTLRNVVME
jgi:hypothetical protein